MNRADVDAILAKIDAVIGSAETEEEREARRRMVERDRQARQIRRVSSGDEMKMG